MHGGGFQGVLLDKLAREVTVAVEGGRVEGEAGMAVLRGLVLGTRVLSLLGAFLLVLL